MPGPGVFIAADHTVNGVGRGGVRLSGRVYGEIERHVTWLRLDSPLSVGPSHRED